MSGSVGSIMLMMLMTKMWFKSVPIFVHALLLMLLLLLLHAHRGSALQSGASLPASFVGEAGVGFLCTPQRCQHKVGACRLQAKVKQSKTGVKDGGVRNTKKNKQKKKKKKKPDTHLSFCCFLFVVCLLCSFWLWLSW